MNSLAQRERELMASLKEVRKSLKKAIETSDEYQSVLTATIEHPLSDGSVMKRTIAKAHAFKVVKSMLVPDEESNDEE